MIEFLKITLMPFITVKKTIIHAINKANTNRTIIKNLELFLKTRIFFEKIP